MQQYNYISISSRGCWYLEKTTRQCVFFCAYFV